MVAPDKLYMIMQEDFLDIANTVPTTKGGSSKPARASQAVAAESSSESPRQKPPGTAAKGRKQSKTKATRVEAGKMAAQRPAPPAPTEDTGKSAKPSKNSPAKETPEEKEQAQESSSYESSSSSSSSSDAPEAPQEEEEPDQKEETEQSSEESNTPDLTQKAIDKADLPTLNPPNTIISTSHGEVVITRHKSEPGSKPQVSAPVASAATLALCGAQSSGSQPESDPWTLKDPWGGFKPSHGVSTADSNESMHQLELRVQNAVLSKLPAQSMEDDVPERMSVLEGQVQQLMAKQQGLETHFRDFSTQQGQQLTAMQGQINSRCKTQPRKE